MAAMPSNNGGDGGAMISTKLAWYVSSQILLKNIVHIHMKMWCYFEYCMWYWFSVILLEILVSRNYNLRGWYVSISFVIQWFKKSLIPEHDNFHNDNPGEVIYEINKLVQQSTAPKEKIYGDWLYVVTLFRYMFFSSSKSI